MIKARDCDVITCKSKDLNLDEMLAENLFIAVNFCHQILELRKWINHACVILSCFLLV